MRQWHDRSHFSFLVCNPQHQPQRHTSTDEMPPTRSKLSHFELIYQHSQHKIKHDEYLFG